MPHLNHDAIRICRVYTPPQHKEGTWILVDKLWPRGLKKDKLEFDLWLKEIAPSTVLRKWYHTSPKDRWEEFAQRYIDELRDKKELIKEIQDIAKNEPVTLFYAAKDIKQNHALVLQSVLLTIGS